ncbi:MAG: helix-turn-helix domain-containing protein [Oscillatoriales cyanobacterium]|nr:MAG: helix-turn-helix domain-containing protein [Oscillatoriales cyanobacterium]
MLAQVTPPRLNEATTVNGLLARVETELSNSPAYRQAVAVLQNLVGDASEVIHDALTAVGREAANLAIALDREFDREVTLPSDLREPLTPAAGLAMANQQSGAIGVWPDAREGGENPFDLPDLLMNLFERNWYPLDLAEPTEPDRPMTRSQARPLASAPILETAFLTDSAIDWESALQETGRILRATRQRLGWNLEQLHAHTHIPLKHLQAIESGQFNVLPERIYVRGFVRRMGESLGLDGIALARALPDTESISVVPGWYQPTQKSAIGVQLQPWHLYAGYGLMVASGLAWVSHSAPSQTTQPIKPMILDRESVVAPQSKVAPAEAAPAANHAALDSLIAPPEAMR